MLHIFGMHFFVVNEWIFYCSRFVLFEVAWGPWSALSDGEHGWMFKISILNFAVGVGYGPMSDSELNN